MDINAAAQIKQARKEKVLKELEIPRDRFFNLIEKWRSVNLRPERDFCAEKIKKILKDNEYFDMEYYFNCAMKICYGYEKNVDTAMRAEFLKSFTYILIHARSFGDQALCMFPLECKNKILYKKPSLPWKLPNTPYITKIIALIKDLQKNYDEMNYRILNANMTYLTLLFIRECVQDGTSFFDTQDDYHKLCPQAFKCELPIINKHLFRCANMYGLVYLSIYAFTTVKDDLSVIILQKTCIQYLEWYKMPLPGLFFKVVSLYGLAEVKLWDLLSSEKTAASLFTLADVLDNSFGPYQGVLKKDIVPDNYSGDCNAYLCTILAYIVDKKIGFDKSFIRNSDWAVDSAAKKAGLKIARAFHRFYEKY